MYFYLYKSKEECISSFGSLYLNKKSYFNNLIDGQFERYTFSIFEDYYENLTSIYGDYMQLPPVEKRNGRHLNYLCFDENYIEKNKELLDNNFK